MGVISSLGAVSGSPSIDPATCTVCWACSDVCPTGTLVQGEGAIRVESNATFGCIACAQCMMVCPSDSVTVTGRKLSPADLVRLPEKSERATSKQLESLFLSRRSVRRFKPEEIARKILDDVVDAASTAPMGIPPWEVGVVALHGRAKVGEVAREVAKGYAGLLKFMDRKLVLNLMGLFLKKAQMEQFRSFILPLGREIVKAGKTGQDVVFYDAPAALLFHTSPYADSADAVIACTYAMLAAESLGLGSCMIGCACPMLARNKGALRKLGIPEGHKPAIALILGYAEVEFVKAVRRPFLSVKDY